MNNSGSKPQRAHVIVWMIGNGNKFLSFFLMSAIHSFLKHRNMQTWTKNGNVKNIQFRFWSPGHDPILTFCFLCSGRHLYFGNLCTKASTTAAPLSFAFLETFMPRTFKIIPEIIEPQLDDIQCGFHSGRSNADQVLILQQSVEVLGACQRRLRLIALIEESFRSSCRSTAAS